MGTRRSTHGRCARRLERSRRQQESQMYRYTTRDYTYRRRSSRACTHLNGNASPSGREGRTHGRFAARHRRRLHDDRYRDGDGDGDMYPEICIQRYESTSTSRERETVERMEESLACMCLCVGSSGTFTRFCLCLCVHWSLYRYWWYSTALRLVDIPVSRRSIPLHSIPFHSAITHGEEQGEETTEERGREGGGRGYLCRSEWYAILLLIVFVMAMHRWEPRVR
jgi:hypothetical protein